MQRGRYAYLHPAIDAPGPPSLRSGLTGFVVHPVGSDLALNLWFFVPPVLLTWFAAASEGWVARAAAAFLLLGTPLAAALT